MDFTFERRLSLRPQVAWNMLSLTSPPCVEVVFGISQCEVLYEEFYRLPETLDKNGFIAGIANFFPVIRLVLPSWEKYMW